MFRFQENMKKLRENPETNRAGLKWDDDEDIKMIAKLKNGDSIDDIALELKRTPGSIKTRIIMNAVNKIDDEHEEIEDVLKEYKITETDIKEYRDRKQQRDEKLNNVNNNTNNNTNNNGNNGNNGNYNKTARYISNPTNKDVYNAILELKTIILDMKNK